MSNLFGGVPLPGRFDRVEKADLTGAQQIAVRADSRDRELTRRFENAERMRREDLNSISGYDVAAIGQFGQEIFQQEVDEARRMIASGELDPTQAAAKIGELKGLYNQFQTHSNAMSEKDKEAFKLVDDPESRAAYQKKLGIGEELNYGADDYAVQHNLAMNGVFQKGSAQKVNGQWTVIDPNTGQRVPFSQVTGFADPTHFYRYGTKSADVGTLDDWAKSKATMTAIGFKDGKWDEARARSTYRDNILTVDDIGRTHRLQLLSTLEDRGLVDHLSDDQKKAFRDGAYTVQTTEDGKQIIVDANGKRLAAFEEIIAKGEDEFVTRSQFDYTMTDSKKGGSGSGDTDLEKDAKNIVVGGMNIPKETAAESVKNMSEADRQTFGKWLASTGGQMGHTLNRFKDGKQPTITGSYMLPNQPNTQKIHIHGVGVNEIGKRVAYILGERRVETPNALGPDFPPSSNTEEFWMEVPIGENVEGVGRDIYQEIYQNHPAMANAVENDLARIGDLGVRNFKPAKPQTEGSVDIPSAQQAQIDRYNELKRMKKEAEQREVGRRVQQGVMPGEARSASTLPSISGQREAKRIQEEMDALLNDPVVGNLIRKQEGRPETYTSANIFKEAPEAKESKGKSEDPFKAIEDMARESSMVIASAPDNIKDQIASVLSEALPERLYVYETENSMGERAVGFKNQAGEDVGDLIFFT